MSDAVLTSVEHGIGAVTLNDPAMRNALGPELMPALASALEQLDAEPAANCLLIAGSDDVFASGADPRTLADPARSAAVQAAAAEFWPRLAAIRKPTVAAVSGWALGSGCELALACDMLVAAEQTQFGLPEITVGVIPGGGATQRLTRAIGKQRAMEMILTGRRFSVEQAFDWGLVNLVTRRNDWRTGAFDLAHEVATRAPVATRLAKQAILAAERELLDEGLETERKLLAEAMATEDRIEGAEALIEGRPPDFKGR